MFFSLDQEHPVRLMNWVSFFNFSVIVPFVYIRIFYWRWNHKVAGISDLERSFRKQRNIVSMWYNMAIWAFEFTGAVLMVSVY